MSITEALRSGVVKITPEMIDLRHRLHRRPEVGLHLPETQATLFDELEGLGLEMTAGKNLTSITAVLRGGQSAGRAVLLRADMDALPLEERTGEAFASEIDGVMHACGHDLHMAMLVGGARLLSQHRDALKGDVVFMFQPGEEGWDGAGAMIEEGVLSASGRRVSSAFGMHVRSDVTPNGVFTTRPGVLKSSSSRLEVKVLGHGGHGSTPHTARDPISAAAEMVGSLQTMITRRFDVFDPVVMTVGMMRGGTRSNIIPDSAEFHATIRTFSPQNSQTVGVYARDVCEGVALAHGLDVEVKHIHEYPATINDPKSAEFMADVVRQVFGSEHYLPMEFPAASSEDFSRVLQEVPGSYIMLGASMSEDFEHAPSNHSSLARFDDSVMARGALLHAELAVRSLALDVVDAGAEKTDSWNVIRNANGSTPE